MGVSSIKQTKKLCFWWANNFKEHSHVYLEHGVPTRAQMNQVQLQQDISLPELSHKHFWGVGGKLYHQINSGVIIFPVLQVCFRMPRGAEWIWLSLNQTIAAFRRKSLRKLPWKPAVCCALTPASLHGPPLCPEGIQTWICTHSMRGEIGNQSSLAQAKMNDILYFHQPEICVPPIINEISTKHRQIAFMCVQKKEMWFVK